MIDSINAQLEDWKYGRDLIKHFITELDDMSLDKEFPRKNLNTIRKQCEEVIQVQGCYVEALTTGFISFNYAPLSDITKSGLISMMDQSRFRDSSNKGSFEPNR